MSRTGNLAFAVRARSKEMLFAVSFLTFTPAIRDRLTATDGLSGQLSYISLMALLWGAILAGGYSRQTVLRWITALVFSLAAYFMAVFEHVTGQFMTYDAFINMIGAIGFTDDAAAQNRTSLVGAIGPALSLFLAVGLPPRPRRPLSTGWFSAIAPWVAAACLTCILFLRGGDSLPGLPPSFTPIGYLALAAYEKATTPVFPRQPVRLPRTAKPIRRNIVLVVDESIAGQYLDINSARGIPTPLSRAWPGISIHNYGLAVSVTNCSAGSNVTLRYGGTRADYQRIIATQPSIWAYAHKAGLRTVYIEAQTTGLKLQNFMTEAESAQIDTFVRLGHLPTEQRDMAVAHALIREMADPRPKFIFINKSGAHFPIQDRYPDAYLRYGPALPRGIRDTFHTGKQLGFTGTPPEWVRYRNSYRNALLWNVGAFFNTVLKQGDFADTTLIYTSDHGQNLHEDGSSGLYTHCGPSAVPAEGLVPLVVIEGGVAALDWDRDLARNRNRSSHFMIFPTLLKLMGYDPVASTARYGKPLDSPSTDPRSFNTLFNARLGRKPEWLVIDPARTALPLTSDVALPEGRAAG